MRAIDVPQLSQHISDLYQRVLAAATTRAELHARMQRGVVTLAHEYGYDGESEYAIALPDTTRLGYIDVVWKSNRQVIAAFEIDSSEREKSMQKLALVNADFAFWVYYGKRPNIRIALPIEPVASFHILRLPPYPAEL